MLLFGDAAQFLSEGMQVMVAFDENDEPVSAEAPSHVELEITYTEPAVKGDTSSGATKYATLETGKEIKVPLLINQGDKVKVDTRTGDYVERVKSRSTIINHQEDPVSHNAGTTASSRIDNILNKG